jgi:diguanylate cyclase (GGDEF)-like protein
MATEKFETPLLQAVLGAARARARILDENGRYLSAAGEEETGLCGRHISDVLPEFVAERVLEALHTALADDAPQSIEYRLPEGESRDMRWFKADLVPLKGAHAHRAVWVEQEITEQKHAERRLEEATLIDPLTEVSNQRHFMRVLDAEITRQARYREPFCLLLLEVDHYDTIRDSYGAETGDACLRETARLIRQQLRHSDVLARLEDAGFGVLLLNTPLHWAKEVAERISSRIARTPLTLAKRTLRLSVSGGVTSLREGDTASSLLWRTEEALFKSESSGQSSINVS